MNAQEIRKQMRALRRALDAQEVEMLSQALCARIRATAAYRQSRSVLLYWPVGGEISPLALLEDAQKRFYLPRVEAPGEMSARLYGGKDALVKGAYGILAPGPDAPRLAAAQLELVIVPGLAFTGAMERVGQGGGYYDRFLPLSRALRVGVCPEFALLDRVPVRAHDQRMDAVVTPSATLMMHEE